MKGVVFSTSFFIVIVAIFINLSNYVHFEHNRAMINNKFKKSMQELAYTVSEEAKSRDEVLEKFEEIVKKQLPKDYEYTTQLMGYLDEPLLIRIRLESRSLVNTFSFKLEETIIEKELSDDEIDDD